MALLMEGMPRPRGQIDKDNLLGVGGDIGMTDSLFQQMGRAPVDELFAGRRSHLVDDDAWDIRVSLAKDAANEALDNPGVWGASEQGGSADRYIRDSISDASGLLIYPGEAVGESKVAPENMTYMTEFSDRLARLKPGWDSNEGGVLSDVLEHELLFKHYPSLANMPIRLTDSAPHGADRMITHGSFDPAEGAIEINTNKSAHDPLGTLLHEVQHAIQKEEGWSSGGNSRMAGSHENYLNIDGEILARDAVERSTQERNAEFDLKDAIKKVQDIKSQSLFDKFFGGGGDLDEAEMALEKARSVHANIGRYPNAMTTYDAGNNRPWRPTR